MRQSAPQKKRLKITGPAMNKKITTAYYNNRSGDITIALHCKIRGKNRVSVLSALYLKGVYNNGLSL